jgi:hypothetical protein
MIPRFVEQDEAEADGYQLSIGTAEFGIAEVGNLLPPPGSSSLPQLANLECQRSRCGRGKQKSFGRLQGGGRSEPPIRTWSLAGQNVARNPRHARQCWASPPNRRRPVRGVGVTRQLQLPRSLCAIMAKMELEMTRLGSKTGDSLMTFKARVREADEGRDCFSPARSRLASDYRRRC